MKLIADLIAKILHNVDNEKEKEEVRQIISDLCRKFPLYKD